MSEDVGKVLQEINKRFGEGILLPLVRAEHMEVEVLPTGSLGLDLALGVGGLPLGRIVEIYGQEMAGKSTLCLHIIAEAHKRNMPCVFIDTENAFDPSYAQRLGVNPTMLYVSQPTSGEQALELADTLVKSGKFGVIVVDSVAGLVPQAEIEGNMGDAVVGLQARLMSQAMRKLTASLSSSGKNTLVVFTNQIRQKIGVMFGNPETTPGGLALRFYASVRIEMRRLAQIKHHDDITGNRVVAKVVKNKVAPPFRKVEFDIIFGRGINRVGEVLDLGVFFEVIRKSGSFYYYGDTRIGQGRENAMNFLASNPELCAEIEAQIRNKDADKLLDGGGDERDSEFFEG